MDFMGLPIVMIENIFTYLSYDDIAKNRLVSKAFNEICMRMLNRGFMMIERRHALALKNVKAQLPRRESERRYHRLSRHCDILTSIETRISMLNMTYSKFIDNGLCCFIPGKVIDEIRRVLTIAETTNTPPRAHEVLQELRDISSMAIEHFDDKISPALRKKLQEGSTPPITHKPSNQTGAVGGAGAGLRAELAHVRRRSLLTARLSLQLASQYNHLHKHMIEYKKIVFRQHRAMKVMLRREKNNNAAIAELKKRIEECDIKYSELTHTNQAVGGKAISASPGAARHFSSQIKLDLSVLPVGTQRHSLLPNMKPRKPVIKLPSLSEESDKPQPPAASPGRPGPAPPPNPRARCQTTIAKIRGITNEIRHLSKLSKDFEGKLKRPLAMSSLSLMPDIKKQKLD